MIKNTLSIIFLIALTSCISNQDLRAINSSLSQATYTTVISGVEGGGLGIIFQAKFLLKENNIKTDSMWVNDKRMATEITQVKDTVFISSFYFEEGNPESVDNRMPRSTFFDADIYKGEIRVFIEGQPFKINIEEFTRKETLPLPM